METNTETKAVLYCPHCGNTSVQVLLLEQPYSERYYGVSDGSVDEFPAIYRIVRCETCQEVLVYSVNQELDSEWGDNLFGTLLFPKQTAFSDAVPEKVRSIYLEAVKVKAISEIAFVILARRVLEEIAHERGAKKGDLAKSIEELVSRGELPTVLAEATSLIRLIGNAGAHASDKKITQPQVWAIDDFLKAVIEYLYVAPKKVNEFKSRFLSVKSATDG